MSPSATLLVYGLDKQGALVTDSISFPVQPPAHRQVNRRAKKGLHVQWTDMVKYWWLTK